MHGRSSRTHRVLIAISTYFRLASYLPHGDSVRVVLRFFARCLAHLAFQLRCVKRGRASPDTEGPQERTAANRQLKTARAGMDIRAPAGQRTAKIRNTSSLDQHHTQQTSLRRSLPTPHTGALRASWDTRPARHCLSLPPRAHRPAPWGYGRDDRWLPLQPEQAKRGPDQRRSGPTYYASALCSPAFSPEFGASASWSGRMSMRQPVSRAARRAFCPSLPMASDSW